MTIEHAYLLKGYALGQNAPQAVLDAVEALIAHFTASEPVEERQPQLEEPQLPAEEPPSAAKKTRKPWSEEARAAAADRMRARRAAGPLTKSAPEPATPGEAPAPSQGGA